MINKLKVIFLLSKQKKIFLPLFFIALYIFIYFLIDFSSQSLVAHDEGLYARRSRLLEESYNWFSPPFEIPHHKTIGSYWFIALSIRLFGYSELSLRLPSILASFLCLVVLYLIALKITDKKSALISVCSLSSMPLWIQYSRYASPDLPFVLCILLVILFFLKSIDTNKKFKEYFYIFVSGLFIATSFFIRSYMAFVPFIGLSPFLSFHIFRKDYLFKTIFSTGLFIGFIPTFLNLYFAFKNFGLLGITSLFDFAKKQAIGAFDYNKLYLVPLKFLYLTFPIGLILIILVVFTRSNNKIKYPLLIYFYPFISLLILLCMSTSYPHYYLFLLPSLSIYFGLYLSSNSFRFTYSKNYITFLLVTVLLLLIAIILLFLVKYEDIIINNSYSNNYILHIISLILVISYISSIRFVFNNRYFRFDLINFFYNIIIVQYFSLSLLFNFGILGNPNYNIKSFLNDIDVSSIVKSNTIYLFGVESKIQTLLSYYLPSSKVVYTFNDIIDHKYIITSDTNSFDSLNYKTIKNFDNHILLIKISK